jgi:outer membrane receptor protein involved in Fe transport
VGARWYDADVDRLVTGSVPLTAPVDVLEVGGSDDGVLPKVGFQYFFEDDRMVYALYSEGFRTGGTNRARGNPTLPIQYESDLLKNYEAGFKSRWMDGRLQFNLIGYHQVWEDMQLELTDPSWFCCDEPYQTMIANVGDAIVDGADIEVTFSATDHWNLGVVATYLFKSEIDDTIEVFDEREPDYVALYIPGGTRLPLASDVNVSAYTEFTWPVDWMGGGDVYIRGQYAHTGDSYNRLVDNDNSGTGYGSRVEQPSYTLLDLRTGFTSADWEFAAYIDNLTDERAVVFHDTNADLFWGRDNVRTLRPRVYGVSLRRYFR